MSTPTTRTTYYTATTLDGYIADEHDSLDWLFVQDHRDEGPLSYAEFITGIGALCMGATTYEWIRDHMATTDEKWGYDVPAFVFSHHPHDKVAGADVRFVTGDVRPVHAEMVAAAGGRDLWVVGGGDLAAQFAEAGLLDDVIVSIAPVTLGTGRPLLPRRFDLALVETLRNGDFVCARYDVVAPRT
jgi:dihydrofolate reductase